MDCSSSANASICTMTIPNKFHSQSHFLFPKHSFGLKNEKHSFRPEWCEKYSCRILGHFFRECWKGVSTQLPCSTLKYVFSPERVFNEICTLARLILVMPATNAVSEHSFSAMRHLKIYLQSTMHQSRLNHLMLLNINKEKIDNYVICYFRNKLKLTCKYLVGGVTFPLKIQTHYCCCIASLFCWLSCWHTHL